MIIAVIIAFSLILVTVVLPDLSNENHQILKEGDFLEYKATGFSNNTNFTSNINITISGADESGIQGYLETSTGYPISAGDIPDYGHNFITFSKQLIAGSNSDFS